MVLGSGVSSKCYVIVLVLLFVTLPTHTKAVALLEQDAVFLKDYCLTLPDNGYQSLRGWACDVESAKAACDDQWEGITCEGNRITQIFLYSAKGGSLPSSLGNLDALTSLRLYRLDIVGSIPESIGNLVELTHLELPVNKLTGSIPKSFSQLVKLDYLTLELNQLTGSMDPLLSLTNISFLDIRENSFDPICWPSSFQPDEVCNIGHLKVCEHTPAGSCLDSVPVNCNDLCPAPKDALPKSEEPAPPLPQSDARFLSDYCSSVPPAMVSKLNGWDCELESATRACSEEWEGVECTNNRISKIFIFHEVGGSLPSSIAGLTEVEVITFYRAGLTGTIPSQIGTLPKLTELRLPFNNLEGELPASLSDLNLEAFMVEFNSFSGPLDPVLNFADIVDFNIRGNNFDPICWTGLMDPARVQACDLTDVYICEHTPPAAECIGHIFIDCSSQCPPPTDFVVPTPSTPTPTPTPSTDSPSPTSSSAVSTEQASSFSTVIIVILSLLVAVLLGLVIYFYRRSSSSTLSGSEFEMGWSGGASDYKDEMETVEGDISLDLTENSSRYVSEEDDSDLGSILDASSPREGSRDLSEFTSQVAASYDDDSQSLLNAGGRGPPRRTTSGQLNPVDDHRPATHRRPLSQSERRGPRRAKSARTLQPSLALSSQTLH